MAISMAVEPHKRHGSTHPAELCPAQKRALALWPRLSRRSVARCGCDPARLANFVSRRTQMPKRSIEAVLSRA
jgi:hypothetical protein